MHDAYISGRSENNIKCVVHDDLGWRNLTTGYNCRFSACHWLYEWFSQFHSCGTYSVLSQSPSIIKICQHLQIWYICIFNNDILCLVIGIICGFSNVSIVIRITLCFCIYIHVNVILSFSKRRVTQISGNHQAVAGWERMARAGVKVPSGGIWAEVRKCESRRTARIATWKSRSITASSGIFSVCLCIVLRQLLLSLSAQ